MPYPLDTFLRDAYRHRNPYPQNHIDIDDRTAEDVACVFCNIYVTVTGEQAFRLTLQQMPFNEPLFTWIKQQGGTVVDRPDTGATFDLTIHDVEVIDELGARIKAIVAKGETYVRCFKYWKWLCPRTAKSMKLFAKHCRAFAKKQARKSEGRA
jgi:hypothetical protein